MDPALVLAIINAESEFEHSSVSHKGAIGLMQLMPSTAARLGVDPYDIEENIKGGIKHLGFLLSRFDSLEMVIAA
ncbi:MAG: lytic transglycosylase domain-containing protein [Deltaproteobacteria bacterium]|nr:lytic transglycosylase domain-containing protein [Deltaproteobacteria bacterium]